MKSLRWIACLLALATACHAGSSIAESVALIVSVPDQKMVILHNGQRVAKFSVSTSRYGLGDRPCSYATPLGTLEIASKIGANAPAGAVFKGRARTGEILRPNSAGRDPIVTRILWLRGLEARNANAFGRAIYIHGTPVERLIGRPASYGCIRMKSRDVIRVFDVVPVGTKIQIVNKPMSRALSEYAVQHQIARSGRVAAN